MLRRGTKRKVPGTDGGAGDSSTVDSRRASGARRAKRDESPQPGDYARNLSNFQTLARKRESMRIKLQALGGGGENAAAAQERRLKERVALEMSLIEGTAKFILACKSQGQVLEAAKTLLTARLRSEMLRFELNRLRRGRGTSPPPSAAAVPLGQGGRRAGPSYASLSLSDVRIPLMWRRKDHINDVGEQRRFAVFCVARIGSQIYDSTLVEPVDRHSTDITFPDVLLFNKVPSYFELKLEVYSHAIDKDQLGQGFTLSSVSSTPKKMARSIGKKVGKTLMAKARECRDFENVGPKFELVASANLTLEHCSESVSTCDLYLEDPSSIPTPYSASASGSSTDLSEGGGKPNPNIVPLFGHFCFRLAALPYCCEEEVIAGELHLVRGEQKGQKEPKTQAVWASLMNWGLRLWTDRSQAEAARAPFDTVPVDRDTRIEEIGDAGLSLTSGGDEDDVDAKACGLSWRFHFEDKENLHRWLVLLLQHASDHRRWKQVAESRMDVYSPRTEDNGEGRAMKRTRSKLVLLYNQT